MKKLKAPHRRKAHSPITKKDTASFLCPVCWQTLTLAVDPSGGTRQSFVYDCEVCCRPLVITLVNINGEISVEVTPE